MHEEAGMHSLELQRRCTAHESLYRHECEYLHDSMASPCGVWAGRWVTWNKLLACPVEHSVTARPGRIPSPALNPPHDTELGPVGKSLCSAEPSRQTLQCSSHDDIATLCVNADKCEKLEQTVYLEPCRKEERCHALALTESVRVNWTSAGL
jgi:hypothetical protein